VCDDKSRIEWRRVAEQASTGKSAAASDVSIVDSSVCESAQGLEYGLYDTSPRPVSGGAALKGGYLGALGVPDRMNVCLVVWKSCRYVTPFSLKVVTPTSA
jgi:hypothetical protein